MGEFAPLELDPRIESPRLALRRFVDDDVPTIAGLAGDRLIAATTARVPHPYTERDARSWLGVQDDLIVNRQALCLGVELRETGALIGAIGLEFGSINPQNAEPGYWIGVPYWGKGYATEATATIIDYGFRRCDVRRMVIQHMAHNPASGRVIAKLGFTHEGTFREHHEKWGQVHDMIYYGMLRREWAEHRRRFEWLPREFE